MNKFFRNLLQFLDPDREWFSKDKWQHGAAFVIIGVLLTIFGESFVRILIYGAVIGFTYEAGQADSSYSAQRSTGVQFLGNPGYGVSPLDLAWDIAGLLVGYGLITLIF